LMKRCSKDYQLTGWRKLGFWRSSLKSLLRSTGKACASTGKNKEKMLRDQVGEYLRLARELNEKMSASSQELYNSAAFDQTLFVILTSLSYYQKMIDKHIDLIERRLLNGEQIPASEKLFSIFEPHTEWISKGKQNKKVELGHKVLIAT